MNFAMALADIPSILKTVEDLAIAFETSGNGEAKKQAVLESLGAIYDVSAPLGAIPFAKDELMKFADLAINTIVTYKNTIGEFIPTGVKTFVEKVETKVEDVAHKVASGIEEGVQAVEHVVEAVHTDVAPTTNSSAPNWMQTNS